MDMGGAVGEPSRPSPEPPLTITEPLMSQKEGTLYGG